MNDREPWAIFNPNGLLSFLSLCKCEKDAWSFFLGYPSIAEDVPFKIAKLREHEIGLYIAKGYRAIRVTVSPQLLEPL